MNDFELIEYTIQPGDTLWDLAGQFNTTVDEIMAVNPDIDPDNLQVGQVILIPDTEQMYTSQRPGEGRPGERRPRERRPEYRRPPFRPPYRPYYPYYPYPVACPAGATPYIVQPGDSLFSIAARYGVSVNTIIVLNPYINFNLPLRVGQVICLPF